MSVSGVRIVVGCSARKVVVALDEYATHCRLRRVLLQLNAGACFRRPQVLRAHPGARVLAQVPNALRGLHARHRWYESERTRLPLRSEQTLACVDAGAPSLGYVTGSVEGRVAIDFFEQGACVSVPWIMQRALGAAFLLNPRSHLLCMRSRPQIFFQMSPQKRGRRGAHLPCQRLRVPPHVRAALVLSMRRPHHRSDPLPEHF